MRCSFLKSPCFCLNQVVRRRDIALKIKEVCEKVDVIAKDRVTYGFDPYRATDIRVIDELQRLTTTSFVDESSAIGRDGEKRNVVSKLLAESSQEAQDVDVISIVGLGGIGKTTLAQLAFNDSEVTAHFEKKIWVCVSEPFDEVRIAKAILEQLEGRATNLVELQSLLQGVSESITGKRLLLVLDDVWTENHGQWEKLKPSLTGCATESRILVTTRKHSVVTMMGTDHVINLEKLSDEVCRSIFNQVAFHKRSKDECERLTEIGDKIASKCKGLPLAAKVLGVDASKLGEATVETSIERVRHLSMMLSEETSFPKSIHKAKGLRSLLIDSSRDPSLGAALLDVFKQLTCIRSLNLSWSSIKEIPKEVGKLIHLRHLNLADCGELESLPETTCDLCNLQSLDVTWCRSLKELPKAIGKLIKLRHLQIYGSGVGFIPKGIERITCLRTLDVFTVCGGGENESKAANLRELKDLNHIGGSLIISNLGGGKEDASDAAEAQLKNKKRLLCLELGFDYNQENGILIEALQPPSYLENLTITRYGGLDLPNWMMTLTRLQVLTLRYCENVEVLPPLGRLPNLERLVLSSLKVRRLDAGFLGIEKDENASINEGEIAKVTAFPKLKELGISYLEEVEEWDGIERRGGEEDANTTSISIMPQLRELMIVNCPLLRALPDYVLAAPLQELFISGCRNLRKRYGKEEMGEDWQKISHIPNIYFHDI
ncbi:disease resistance protein RGA4 [Populus alba x Populus x berolinensis]|nr:disease resistance protein RGA4 [Populus alba x Populus x berolinensis]